MTEPLKISDFFYGSKLSDDERLNIAALIRKRAEGKINDADWERAMNIIKQTCRGE